MQPTPAEVARTLAAGHLPALAHVACRPGPFPGRHVTDDPGRLLLLSPVGGALTVALRPAEGTDDTAMVLDISDVPPMAGSPSLGRVWVSGWAKGLRAARGAPARPASAGSGCPAGPSGSRATRRGRPPSTTPTSTPPATCSTSGP